MTTSSDTQPRTPARRPGGSSVRASVFLPAAVLAVVFVALTMADPVTALDWLKGARDFVSENFGWYYTFLVTGFVLFCLWVGLSHFGDIKLAPEDEEPEFKLITWLSMLFAAGMGIGLVFWGVAEPLNHLASPKPGVAGEPSELANAAIAQTILHWGVHPWAIYVVVGLAVAYAVHRKGRPISIRWALEPLLGDRVKGWVGDVIDVAAILGTLFGVATSLGLGVLQIAAGLEFLDVVQDPGNWTLILLIGGITLVAIVSVVTGVKKGIKWLSQINMGLAGAILLFVLIAGPTLFLFREVVESVGLYLQNILRLSFDTTALQGEEGAAWQSGWTAFYWGWWISWAPFVGVFIARISRGRTIREFVAGVLLVPTALTIVWFSVFGGAALQREVAGAGGLIAEDGTVSTEGSLFEMLDGLPGGSFVVGVAIILIVLFFVTSSDSGSLVVDMLASGGDPEPPTWSRVFWAVAEGAVAAALILAGGGDDTSGLTALQAAAIVIALPFSVIMIGMCVASWRAFSAERKAMLRVQRRQQREEFTEHVTQNLIDDGLVEANHVPAGPKT